MHKKGVFGAVFDLKRPKNFHQSEIRVFLSVIYFNYFLFIIIFASLLQIVGKR